MKGATNQDLNKSKEQMKSVLESRKKKGEMPRPAPSEETCQGPDESAKDADALVHLFEETLRSVQSATILQAMKDQEKTLNDQARKKELMVIMGSLVDIKAGMMLASADLVHQIDILQLKIVENMSRD